MISQGVRDRRATIRPRRARGSIRTRGALLAAWGLGLTAAFLFSRGCGPADFPASLTAFVPPTVLSWFDTRGCDLGRLPTLLTSFVTDFVDHPVVAMTGLGRALAGSALAALMVLAWFGAGDLLLGRGRVGPRRHREAAVDHPAGDGRALDLAERCALGAGAWSLGWFFLGVFFLYRTWIAVVALAIGVALGVVAMAREGRERRGARRRRGRVDAVSAPITAPPTLPHVSRAALGLTLLALASGLVAALAPPTVKDTLLYHLAVPKAYVAAGGGGDVAGNLASYYPLGHEMHNVWALLLGGPGDPWRIGEAAAGATAFAWAPLLLAIVYGWCRERGLDRAWALIGALLIATIPTVYHVAASVYVDVAVAAYVALAVRATGRWWTTLDPSWLRRLALALGWALCIKLTAVSLVLPLAAMVVLRGWRAHRARGGGVAAARLVAAGLSAVAVAGLLASPWYARTWLRTGSPVFPFYVDVWGGSAPGWDLNRSYQYEALFGVYGGARASTLDYLLAPLRLAVAAQPEVPSHYDGVLGIALLFGLPLVIHALWRGALDAETRIAAAAAGAFFVAWLLGSQQLRYLLPAAPGWALAVVASSSAARAREPRARRALQWSLIGMAAAGLLVIGAWFTEQAPLRVVLGGEGRDAYLARRLDYYPYYAIVNRELPPDARVWLINLRRDTYHLERPYFADYIFEDWTLRDWVRAAGGADEVRARARAAGITHVLVRHDLLFDYDRSPIVDDSRPRGENLARLALMASFFWDGTRLIRGDQKFWLVELPGAPALR